LIIFVQINEHKAEKQLRMKRKVKKAVQATARPGWRTVVPAGLKWAVRMPVPAVFVVVVAVLFVACGSPRLGVYKVRLQNVVSSPPPPVRDMMFSTAEQPDGSTCYIYETPFLKTTWKLSNTRFGLVLENKTADSLVVFWEEAAYVNQHMDTLRVIHDGIDFFEKEREQLPTILDPLGKVTDFLIPVDNIRYDPDNFTLWSINHLFYEGKRDIGQRVIVILPMEIQGERIEYRFIFLVEDWKVGL
jgi:hypothetical protein